MATICLASLNYAPEPIGIGPYSQGWAEALVQHGHEVQVVCGRPFYPQWKAFAGFDAEYRWTVEGGVHVLRVPHYIPANPNGARRMMHHASFARNLGKGLKMAADVSAPDAVVAVAPALLAAPISLRHARGHSAVSWLHMQDFEVEAALATGLLPRSLSGWGARFERSMLQRFDHVSSISPRMVERVVAKRGSGHGVHEARNWAEPMVGHCSANGALMRERLGLPEGLLALYSGNLARKQGIGIILDTAEEMKGRKGLHFVICGEGPAANDVMDAAQRLANLHYRPLQPRAALPDLLDMADIHLLPQIAGAKDLVLPSKLANMLASGKPVVATAEADSSLAREVGGCGRVVEPGNRDALVQAIAELAASRRERAALGQSARERADQRWSKSALVDDFADAIDRAIQGRRK